MDTRQFVTGIVLMGAIAATPAFAQEGRRPSGRERQQSQEENRGDRGEAGRVTGRAVRREAPRPQPAAPPQQVQRAPQPNSPRQDQVRRDDRNCAYQGRRDDRGRYDDRGGYDNRGRYDDRRYDSRRAVPRPYYPYYANRGYGPRRYIVPRYVRPVVVNVVPYRPYYYRPRIAFGIYYGAGGSYPYGYTPRGYYDPLPGRPYGGLRITGFSRGAQVFADGYYVGLVDDFDGVFQHVNLEAGPHRIEIVEPGYQGFEFDVMIQPGRTTTFRADGYRY